MSPKRGSPWGRPALPNGLPPSATTPMLMFAWRAQVGNARKIWRSQVGVEAIVFRVLKRWLVRAPTAVLSGAKLSVRWAASGHGFPQVAGTQRSSSCSTSSGRRRGGTGRSSFLRSVCECSGSPPAWREGFFPVPAQGRSQATGRVRCDRGVGTADGLRSQRRGTFLRFPERIAYFFEGGKNFSDFSNFFCHAITRPSCPDVGRNG